MLILEGTGRRLIGDSSELYEPGDLTLIGAELPHTYASHPGVDRNAAVIVQWLPDFLGGDLWRSPEFADVARLLDAARRGLVFDRPPADVVAQLPGLRDLTPVWRTLALLGILQRLAEDDGGRQLASASYVPDLGAATRRRIDTACSYVRAAYDRPITLDDVASRVQLSRSAFSRFFRRTMGRTFTDYVNEVRIDAACRLLIETDLPVTAVAARCGYRNLSHFNRRFLRRKGTQPRRYRRQYRAG